MKRTIEYILTLVMAVTMSGNAIAGGSGMIVYDPWNWTQNINNTLKTITQLAEDIQRTQDDIIKISQLYELMHYHNLDTTLLDGIYNNRVESAEYQLNNAFALSYDVNRLHGGFNSVYPTWTDDSGLGAQDYTRMVNDWEQNTIDTIYQSIDGQAVQPQTDNGHVNLHQLLAKKGETKGNLEAMQNMAQIMGIAAEQLIILNEMSSKHFRAQDVKMLGDLKTIRET